MNVHNFTDDDSSEDDEFYFDDDFEKYKNPVVKDKETQDMNEVFARSITLNKTHQRDFNLIQINEHYSITKEWLNSSLGELELHHAIITSKTKASQVEQTISTKSTDIRQAKQIKENAMKSLETSLFKLFAASQDPFWLNLILIENTRDFRTNKYNTLACLIAKFFSKWAKGSDVLLSDELKQYAFVISTNHHLFMIDYIFGVYKLCSNPMIVPYLNHKLKNVKERKDKAILISSLNLHDNYDFEEILLPLLLEDKINVIEKYLENSPKQQINFVQYLDKMNHQNALISSYIYKFKVEIVQIDKLSKKQLAKLQTRLMKLYNINPELCPNVTNIKYYKSIRHLVYRRYVEKSIMHMPWAELISECLSQASYLAESFIQMLAEYNDYREINIWLAKLKPAKIPRYIEENAKMYIVNNPHDDLTELTDNLFDLELEKKFYPLKINDIVYVDDKEKFLKFIDEVLQETISQESVYVGVDSEWKPTCVAGLDLEANIHAALVQISTHKKIYLLDMLALSSFYHEISELFATKFLYNKKVIKIGYGFTEDMKILSRSFKLTNADAFRQTVLDLAAWVNHLALNNIPLFESNQDLPKSEEKATGLSELVRLCFGKPLNKSEQVSNWEKRPLRASQITYAALDAFCLVEAFEYIKNRLTQLNIKPDHHTFLGRKLKQSNKVPLLNSISHTQYTTDKILETHEDKRLKEVTKFDDNNFCLNLSPIRPQDLRLICDNMLGGLGKELRRCGVDCLILDNNVEHVEVARIARLENRYALSSGLPFHMIRSQLPDGKCIHVRTDNAKEQCSRVLKIFNVVVTVADLFSRCRACNTGSYTIISQKQAKALWLKYKKEHPDLFTDGEDFVEKKKTKSKSSIKSIQPCDEYSLNGDEDLKIKIDMNTYHLRGYPEVRVQFESIFATTIQIVDTYYICNGCGHIYWEGPHWQNIETRFAHVLAQQETETQRTDSVIDQNDDINI